MRVRMKTVGAGPQGVWAAGQVVDVDATTAQKLIEGRFADAVDPVEGPVSEPKTPTEKPKTEKRLTRKGR
ncbi:MAG: hypothetical protein ACM3XZ_05185 [Betaproteobacteria bacterium]